MDIEKNLARRTTSTGAHTQHAAVVEALWRKGDKTMVIGRTKVSLMTRELVLLIGSVQ